MKVWMLEVRTYDGPYEIIGLYSSIEKALAFCELDGKKFGAEDIDAWIRENYKVTEMEVR